MMRNIGVKYDSRIQALVTPGQIQTVYIKSKRYHSPDQIFSILSSAHILDPKSPRSDHIYIVACHLPGAPSYGGVRTWVEGSQTCGDRALAEASNLLGCK